MPQGFNIIPQIYIGTVKDIINKFIRKGMKKHFKMLCNLSLY